MDDVLSLIEPFGCSLDWYFIELEPSNWTRIDEWVTPPKWVSAWWHEIGQGNLLKLQWETLKAFSKHTGHVDNALIVAVTSAKLLPSEPLDLNGPDFEIVLQAFDSCLWAITSAEKELADVLCGHFPNSKRFHTRNGIITSHVVNRRGALARLSSGAKAHILHPLYIGAEAPTS